MAPVGGTDNPTLANLPGECGGAAQSRARSNYGKIIPQWRKK